MEINGIVHSVISVRIGMGILCLPCHCVICGLFAQNRFVSQYKEKCLFPLSFYFRLGHHFCLFCSVDEGIFSFIGYFLLTSYYTTVFIERSGMNLPRLYTHVFQYHAYFCVCNNSAAMFWCHWLTVHASFWRYHGSFCQYHGLGL